MKKINLKKTLVQKIKDFDIIIFDLDNTLYSEDNYITPALMEVSKYLKRKIKISKHVIFKDLKAIKYKKVKIFNVFLKKYNLSKKEYKLVLTKCIKIYQNFNCLNFKEVKSHKALLQKFYKQKDFFLVTNGNYHRQMRKIKNLKIKKFFKKIFVLDGKKNKLKPSTKDVKSLLIFLKENKRKKAIYIGDDNLIDRQFSKNLKISFLRYEF